MMFQSGFSSVLQILSPGALHHSYSSWFTDGWACVVYLVLSAADGLPESFFSSSYPCIDLRLSRWRMAVDKR